MKEPLVDDFYSGFEGYPELEFERVVDGEVVHRVRIWDGRFAALMERVFPEASGWTGLALPYHLLQGWYEVSPWPIPDGILREVLLQWAAISTEGCKLEEIEVHQAVLRLLEEAVRTDTRVQVSYS